MQKIEYTFPRLKYIEPPFIQQTNEMTTDLSELFCLLGFQVSFLYIESYFSAWFSELN